MKYLLGVLLAGISLQAESICGRTYETPDAYKVHIVCVPSISGKPAQTQVFLRPKFGRAVDITLGDQAWIVRTYKDGDGTVWAGASFDGVLFEELPKIVILVAAGAL